MVLLGDVDVVAPLFETDAHAGELRGDDAQVLERHILDRQLRTVHGGHADEAAHLDHVGQQPVLRAAQRFDAFDFEQVRGDARNLRAHSVEHFAQLLEVRFAGRVVDRRPAFGHHGGHHDVGRAGHRRLVQQHVGSLQLPAFDHEELVGDVEVELRAEFLESEEMGVEPASADLVAARLGDVSLAEPRQHRADQHNRTPQSRAALAVIVRFEVFEINVAGAERVGVLRELLHLHAHAAEQFDELHHIENPGDVPDDDPLGRQQRGAEYLQRFVFGSLGRDFAPQSVATFDFENCHMCCRVLSV